MGGYLICQFCWDWWGEYISIPVFQFFWEPCLYISFSLSLFSEELVFGFLWTVAVNPKNRLDNRHGSVGLFLVPTTALKPRFTFLDEWIRQMYFPSSMDAALRVTTRADRSFQCSRTMSRVWSSGIFLASIPQFGFCRGIQLSKSASESRIRSYHDAEIGGTAFCATSGGGGSLPQMASIIGLCRSATFDLGSSQR